MSDFLKPRENSREYHRLYAYNKRHGIPMTRTCLICGKTFEVTNEFRTYCSKECVAENDRRRMAAKAAVKAEKVCPICGKTFVAKVTAVCCSKKCSCKLISNRRKDERHAALTETVCKFCGKTFMPTRVGNVFCCNKCSRDYANHGGDETVRAAKAAKREAAKAAKALERYVKVCKFCGKTFDVDSRHQNAKYCSSACGGYAKSYPSAEVRDRILAERQRRREKRETEATFGLTAEDRQSVIDAQDGDPSLLWQRSQAWSPKQRKFAKKRYQIIHGL